MISHITIENLGLIKNTSCAIQKGFTAITGETGAGKSFFCKALEIGLGSRISRIPDHKTVVEIKCFGHVFRRVMDKGKSRFFIDDLPEPLEKAETILEGRFHLHRQHDTQFLSSVSAPADLLDAAMQHPELKKQFQQAYSAWRKQKKEWEHHTEALEKMKDQQAFWQFSLDQMSEVSCTEEEIEQAEHIIRTQTDNAHTKEYIAKAITALSSEDFSALSSLQTAEEALKKIGHEGSDAIGACIGSIVDLVGKLEKQTPTDDGSFDAAKLMLSQVQKWCKQHGVISITDLIRKKENLVQKLQQIEHEETTCEELAQKTKELYDTAINAAKLLSEARKAFIPHFEKTITKSCQELGMPPARFIVQATPGEMTSSGIETIDFLFSANQNQTPLPLSSVASGGEKSRIMLSLHQFIADDSVIIFDEIDTGVSGAIAEKMADMMKKLSQTRQVIAITHLAQIASKADHQLVVEKTHMDHETVSQMRYVEGVERQKAIASLIAGETITEEAMHAARILLQ